MMDNDDIVYVRNLSQVERGERLARGLLDNNVLHSLCDTFMHFTVCIRQRQVCAVCICVRARTCSCTSTKRQGIVFVRWLPIDKNRCLVLVWETSKCKLFESIFKLLNEVTDQTLEFSLDSTI